MEMTQEFINAFVIAAHSDLEKVKALADENPELLYVNAVWQETPIQAASHMAHRPILEYLLSKGVPLDCFAAIILGMNDRVAAFLEGDPSLVSARGAHGIPMVFYPAAAGNIEAGEMLLARGADLNTGAGAQTALHGAVHFGQKEYLRWLLERGANPNVQSYDGKTPLSVAEEKGNQAMAELLRAHGAGA